MLSQKEPAYDIIKPSKLARLSGRGSLRWHRTSIAMKIDQTLTSIAFAASTLFFAATATAADPSVSQLKNGSSEKIEWGKHWAGPELRNAKSLEGKVVLLKIWGG